MTKTTKTITVRAKIEAIDRFVAMCHEQGKAPSRVLRDVIEAPLTTIRPVARDQVKTVTISEPWKNPHGGLKTKRVQSAPLAKPTGFDALTGEPIFKSGVGPRGGKKK